MNDAYYNGEVTDAVFCLSGASQKQQIAIIAQSTVELKQPDGSTREETVTKTDYLPLKEDSKFGLKSSPYCGESHKVANLSRVRDVAIKRGNLKEGATLADLVAHIKENGGHIPAIVGAKVHIRESYEASYDNWSCDFRFLDIESEFKLAIEPADVSALTL